MHFVPLFGALGLAVASGAPLTQASTVISSSDSAYVARSFFDFAYDGYANQTRSAFEQYMIYSCDVSGDTSTLYMGMRYSPQNSPITIDFGWFAETSDYGDYYDASIFEDSGNFWQFYVNLRYNTGRGQSWFSDQGIAYYLYGIGVYDVVGNERSYAPFTVMGRNHADYFWHAPRSGELLDTLNYQSGWQPTYDVFTDFGGVDFMYFKPSGVSSIFYSDELDGLSDLNLTGTDWTAISDFYSIQARSDIVTAFDPLYQRIWLYSNSFLSEIFCIGRKDPYYGDEQAYQAGFDDGYEEGYYDGANFEGHLEVVNFYDVFSMIVSTPLTFLYTALDIELFSGTPYAFNPGTFVLSVLCILMIWRIVVMVIGIKNGG